MKTAINYATGYTTSKDGTCIGYRILGSGPAVILVHGGLMASQNLMRLAQILADEFTVYVPDRRGRGLSGPCDVHHSLKTEGEDLQAIIQQTGADSIFGLSAGAICVLQTALLTPSFKKIILYEPPVPFPTNNPISWGPAYEVAMEQQNLGKALATILKGTGDPSLFSALPSFLLAPLFNLGLKSDGKKSTDDNSVSLTSLIGTMHYDLISIRGSSSLITEFRKINAEILLMGGTKTLRSLKRSLDELHQVMPQAKRLTLQGVGHIAADNDEQPAIVANAIATFFKSGNMV